MFASDGIYLLTVYGALPGLFNLENFDFRADLSPRWICHSDRSVTVIDLSLFVVKLVLSP